MSTKLNIVPFVSIDHMMKLVLTIGVERFLVGLMDNIETDVQRWESFVRSPQVALHNHEAEITNLNSNHAQTAVGLGDPAGQIGGTIWCHPGTDPENGLLAGAPGFEPGNGGTKNRCLTTWRRPNRCGVYIIGPMAAGNTVLLRDTYLQERPKSPLAALPPRRYKTGLPRIFGVGV